MIPKYVSEYNIKPNPTSVRSGMDSILPGLKDLEVSPASSSNMASTDEQEGKVSGTKIVFHIA